MRFTTNVSRYGRLCWKEICVEHLTRETLSLNRLGVDGAALGGLLNLYLCWTPFSIALWWLQSTRYLQITFPYDLITKWWSLNILVYNFHAPCSQSRVESCPQQMLVHPPFSGFSPHVSWQCFVLHLEMVWLKKKRLYCSRNWDIVQCWLLYLYSNDLVFWRFLSVVN